MAEVALAHSYPELFQVTGSLQSLVLRTEDISRHKEVMIGCHSWADLVRLGGAPGAGAAGAGGCAESRWPAAGPLVVPSALLRRALPRRGRSPACLGRMASGR